MPSEYSSTSCGSEALAWELAFVSGLALSSDQLRSLIVVFFVIKEKKWLKAPFGKVISREEITFQILIVHELR